jgi:hypothetical protein
VGDRGDELRSIFASTAGGVMTDEVGAVTGDLEVSTSLAGDDLRVFVRYAGAEEWYTVSGSPLRAQAGTSHAGLHQRVVERLTMPGAVADGNEEATSLRDPPTA